MIRVIIEPHWNLKEDISIRTFPAEDVIIEPHWNLKDDDKSFNFVPGMVIIEPHWNLKDTRPVSVYPFSSNNRTTLESKACGLCPSVREPDRNNRTTLESKVEFF